MGEKCYMKSIFNLKYNRKIVFTPTNNRIYPIIFRKLRIFASVKTNGVVKR